MPMIADAGRPLCIIAPRNRRLSSRIAPASVGESPTLVNSELPSNERQVDSALRRNECRRRINAEVVIGQPKWRTGYVRAQDAGRRPELEEVRKRRISSCVDFAERYDRGAVVAVDPISCDDSLRCWVQNQ